MQTIITFILFTGMVAVLTWLITRGKGTDTGEGFFLAGRSLTGVFIAGSLLLTNLSTEQLIGLNAGAFTEGLSVMAWEVIAGFSLVILALVFLPRYLKSGIATIPQFLEERYGSAVRTSATIIFIVAYMLILLPFVLYLGARGLSGMFGFAVDAWAERFSDHLGGDHFYRLRRGSLRDFWRLAGRCGVGHFQWRGAVDWRIDDHVLRAPGRGGYRRRHH